MLRRVGLDDVSPRQAVTTTLVTLLLLLLVFFVWQAARAAVALDRAREQSTTLLLQLAQGSTDDARSTAAQLRDSTADAHRHTSGPLWALGSHVPVVGDDIGAMRTVAAQLDLIAEEAVPPVVDVSQKIGIQTFTPRDGRIDLEALRTLRPALDRADEVLAEADRQLGSIDTGSLVGRLREPITRLRSDVATGAFAASAAHDAADLLPEMLGGEGTKRYLLVVQNNAEVRSTGGLPGSLSVITAKQGKLSMGKQGGTATIGIADKPVVKLTADEQSVFSTAMATDFRDANFTPDFPRAAQIVRAFADKAFDTTFDGVISVDPVTLGYLLDGVGPVLLDDGTQLTASSAVDELLHGVYLRYADDLAQQDRVFADAARSIFDAMVGGDADAQRVVEALVRSARENRVLVWSKDDSIEGAVRRTGLSGVLPGGRKNPAVGVYLNDSTGAKMQYYLESGSALRSIRCLDGDRQVLDLRTSLASSAPANASRLPVSVTGRGTFFPRGVQGVNVRIFAPRGGSIDEISIDGKRQTVSGGTLDGRQVAVVPVRLKPGEDVAVSVRMTTAPGAPGRAVLSTTPGIQPAANDVSTRSACG
ncbi:hypothetical protein ASD11_01600 [Aeromicrobium sp. Root495]|nr:hypothetical protein ASD11_01600 [Aeromicrobium sp. Root495]